jgi:flagellar biosynthesis protein FlhA
VEDAGNNAVLVVSPVLRPWLSKAVKHRTEGLAVLSYSEIPDDQSVKVIETVEIASRDGMNE